MPLFTKLFRARAGVFTERIFHDDAAANELMRQGVGLAGIPGFECYFLRGNENTPGSRLVVVGKSTTGDTDYHCQFEVRHFQWQWQPDTVHLRFVCTAVDKSRLRAWVEAAELRNV